MATASLWQLKRALVARGTRASAFPGAVTLQSAGEPLRGTSAYMSRP